MIYYIEYANIPQYATLHYPIIQLEPPNNFIKKKKKIPLEKMERWCWTEAKPVVASQMVSQAKY